MNLQACGGPAIRASLRTLTLRLPPPQVVMPTNQPSNEKPQLKINANGEAVEEDKVLHPLRPPISPSNCQCHMAVCWYPLLLTGIPCLPRAQAEIAKKPFQILLVAVLREYLALEMKVLPRRRIPGIGASKRRCFCCPLTSPSSAPLMGWVAGSGTSL